MRKLWWLFAVGIIVMLLGVYAASNRYAVLDAEYGPSTKFWFKGQVPAGKEMATPGSIAIIMPSGSDLQDYAGIILCSRMTHRKVLYYIQRGWKSPRQFEGNVFGISDIETSLGEGADYIIRVNAKEWSCHGSPLFRRWRGHVVIAGEPIGKPDDQSRRLLYKFGGEMEIHGTLLGTIKHGSLPMEVADIVADQIASRYEDGLKIATKVYQSGTSDRSFAEEGYLQGHVHRRYAMGRLVKNKDSLSYVKGGM